MITENNEPTDDSTSIKEVREIYSSIPIYTPIVPTEENGILTYAIEFDKTDNIIKI